MMQKLKHPNKKTYEVENLRVKEHILPGDEKAVKCLEFTVVGKNHNWDFWGLHDELLKLNPRLKVKE